MSWASYEWKEGLPLKALQKIEELERHRDKLRKELQQRQFQIDTIEQVGGIRDRGQFILHISYRLTAQSWRLLYNCDNMMDRVGVKISVTL